MSHESDVCTLEMPTVETLAELETHIQSRLNGRLRDFRLSLHDGGLILKGHAYTYYAKQLAQHATMEAIDVPIHANEMNLHQRGAQQVILHRGADPTFVLLKEQMLEVITPVVEPLDTCGGGDTFFAALAIGLAQRKPIEEAIRFAAAAGTLNVTRHGLGTGNLEDIKTLSRHVQVRPLNEGNL